MASLEITTVLRFKCIIYFCKILFSFNSYKARIVQNKNVGMVYCLHYNNIVFPQSHDAVLNRLGSIITYSMNEKCLLVLKKFNLVLLTIADNCGGFHAAIVCLQKRT